MASSSIIHVHTPPPVSNSTQTQRTTPALSLNSCSQTSRVDSLRSKVRSNQFQEALSAYVDMNLSGGVPPDNFAFPAVLKSVVGLQDLKLGKQIHAHVVKFGYESSSVNVANSLVNMYGKCGDPKDVYKVFDRIPERDQISWNSMISALCRFEEWETALEALNSMLQENVEPSSFTLVSLALACSNLSKYDGLRLGKQVHGICFKLGDWKTFTINALMAMYAKLGRVDYANALFQFFEGRDLVTWNTMLSSLSQNDKFLEALLLFRSMILQGIKPDGVTISSLLPACSHLEMLQFGKQIHAYVLRNEILFGNSFVASALVDMYCNCRKVESGRWVFDGIENRKTGLWNAMIAGYTQNEYDEEALTLFFEMVAVAGIGPNSTTMASVVPAIVRSEAFPHKEGIHGYIIKYGLDKDRFVQNALMDMYCRMGKIEVAKTMFDTKEVKDIVSWNTMITGYVVRGQHDSALLLVQEMQRNPEIIDGPVYGEDNKNVPLKPNSITLMTVLPGCGTLAALAKGKEIHAYAIKNILASDVAVGSALVDMYAKCGCLRLSRKVFDQMPVRNAITWNVMIMGYGMHGQGEKALQLFDIMGNEVKPNEVTLIAIFAACSHSGMVSEGLNIFYRMRDYGIDPTPDHYACIVDLLGRAGQVEKAYELINTMPAKLDKAVAWSSLLGSCRIHQNVEIGEIAARNLFILQPYVASHYVLLSNIYSSAGLWDKAMDVRKKMKEMGVRKEPGCSWIEFGDEVHKFIAGDSSHPQTEQLYEFLESLSEKMKKEGFVPDTSCVLHNIDESEKETMLCGHSEKLAIAFGILNTHGSSTIRVAKNLRVCNDCHEAAKYISKITDREIVLRDVRRFHHFRNGVCSCGGYW